MAGSLSREIEWAPEVELGKQRDGLGPCRGGGGEQRDGLGP